MLHNRFGLAACAAVALSSSAVAIPIFGDTANTVGDTGVNISGTMNYAFLGGNAGELTVTMTNTSSVGGFVTGFIFNAGNSGVSVALTSSTHPTLVDAPGQNGAPFGSPFVGGAAIGGNWLGGGSPNSGIAVNATGTFVFSITGASAGSLTDGTFLTGPYTHNFLVRFRATDGPDGSSKLPVIPAPGGVAVLGLAGLAAGRRRR